MKLYQIIESLAAESSTKAKSAILTKYKDRLDLKAYFKATLDPFINYFIRVKDVPSISGDLNLELKMISDVVAQLNGRIFTGNAAKRYVCHNERFGDVVLQSSRHQG